VLRSIKQCMVRLAMAALLQFFGSLAAAVRLLGREHAPDSLDPALVQRILVIRLDLLGDLVNSMPAVAALHERFPTARITMLTLPRTAAIPRQFAFVDEVLTFDPRILRVPRNWLRPATLGHTITLALALRRAHYDLCLSLYGPVAGIWAYVSGARRRIGYAAEARPALFSDPVPGGRFDRLEHEVRWDLRLAAAAGASPAYRAPALQVRPEVAARMAEKLAALGVRPGDRLVGIHGGAVNGSAKRWPATHWAALADRLIARHGVRIVLTGSANERPISEAIRTRMRESPIVLAGETDIDELLAVLARCDLVLSGDSGPLHMAVALGRPAVAMYGPTDPLTYGPSPRTGQHVIVLRRGLPCSPCYTIHATAECPYGQPACMIDITVGEVFEAATRLLEHSA
jgi:lipopolysaccharide heptosyltransferase II